MREENIGFNNNYIRALYILIINLCNKPCHCPNNEYWGDYTLGD